VAILLAVAAGAPAFAQSRETIAATVNDELITTYDVRQRARMLLAFSDAEQTQDMMSLAEEQALRTLVDEKLQLQEAAVFNLEVEDQMVDDALGLIAEQSGTDIETNVAELRAAGVEPQTLRDQIRAEIAWENLIKGRYRDSVTIGSDQIDQVLQEIVQSLREPQYRVAEIFMAINTVADEPAVRARMDGVIEQLRAGANFPAIAQQYSDGPTAERGGDLGYQAIGQFPSDIAPVVQGLPVGGVGGPVRAAGGYYVVALIDKRDAASAEQLTLKAVILPVGEGASDADREEARQTLQAATRDVQSCDAADTVASRVEGAFVSDLGTLSGSALQPQVRDALAGVEPGRASAAILSPLGAQVFFLCGREIGGPGLPSRAEIAAQLEDQRLSMLARRYLRDLHREALIDIRGEQAPELAP
jgi:peptidyl-prolyl cis-trans isomerase SurA